MTVDPGDRRAERGVTLIELVVVMVIGLILAGAAIATYDGTEDTARRQEAIVAAHSLQKSVESFRRDREGRVPSRPTDWPVAIKGPVDADASRPYLRSRFPEGIRLDVNRRFAGNVSAIVGAHAPPNARFSVEFLAISPDANPSTAVATIYVIAIRDRATIVCTLTNDPTVAEGETC